MAMNVGAEMVSDDSVRVSWDSVDFPGISGYTIYYRQTDSGENEMNADVISNSILIENLMANVEYQFQVAAIAELDGEVIVGQRSTINAMSILTVIATKSIPSGKSFGTTDIATGAETFRDTSTRDVSIAVVVTFSLTIVLCATVLLVGLGLYCTRISSKK